ncbi:SDR family NAD(P)-dependent oxidoreductase [Deinococcus maricopensis]|uniref:Short-chain dehydrogenase/reductase SDR n=1 Tax=Deinococcus maricopensis (strain DSM 21211 / LMG 22137 / NRRL B-23946 / LB-34) TaxID=709986 RepID=E8U8G5_DEIML|nr:SDR family oxidoreductase [Deinococcus maricopensis]ADV67354.1 short-chain dehydrogenase/reductase SDR [Deinococcus maricopensis DSM 21211]
MFAKRLTLTAAALACVAAWEFRRARTRQSLRGRVVVITGASTGMGRAVALLSAERGARVVLAARDEVQLERVAQDARALGAEALVVPTDVTDRAQVQALVDAAVDRFGRVDVMFNHAGDYFVDSVEHSEEARVRALIDVNVMGVLYGVQAALPVMRRQGGGHIINTASVEGRVAFPYTGVYAGTKAFVEVLTQALRQELMHIERTGVRVSALLPAAVRTPLFDVGVNVKAGGRGAHLVRPVQEATQVARAVVDAMEVYRPVIYPLRLAQGFPVLYDLLPGLADRVHSHLRVDAHTNLMSYRERGTNSAEKPIPPVVQDGRLIG